MPEPGTPLEPLDASFFQLEFTGIPPKIFTQVTMPNVMVPIASSEETGANGQPVRRRSVGTAAYSEMTCTGGVTTDKSLETWMKEVIEKGIGAAGAANEKEGMLNAYDTSTALLASWKLVGCVITSLTMGGTLSTGQQSHMTFSATFDVLAVDRMT